jgi:uncharacterized membrane protein
LGRVPACGGQKRRGGGRVKEVGLHNKSLWLGLAAVIVAHLLISFPLAYFLNIWADEASTLYSTQRGIGFALDNTLADEKQAPLYFWLLSLWRNLNGSIIFARTFSIICSLAAIVLFFKLARRFFDGRPALFVTLLFALHPFLIWASVEIRVYSLVVCLSLALLNLWFSTYFESSVGRVPRAGSLSFLAVAVVSLYANYYLGFLLAGLFVSLVIARKWRVAAAYFFNMIAAGVLFAPLIWAVRSQFAANTVAFQTERSLVVGLKLLWNTFLTFVLPTEIYPLEQISTVSFVRVWFVRIAAILLIALAVRKRRELLDPKVLALAGATATILMFFLIAYLALGEVYVAIRHAAVLFAPILLMAAIVIGRLFSHKIWPAILIVYLALFSYSLSTLYPNLAKRGDWARVGEYIQQNERPNQPIVVFTTFDALALPYHYKGLNNIVPDEKFFDWEIEAPAGAPDAWRRQTEFILSEIPPGADEIWLLTNEKCDVKQSCLPLENFIVENYTVVEERKFYLEKVRLLRKKK